MYSHRLYWINVSKRAKTDFYRPQRSSGKIMFLHLSVSHSVQGGCLPLVPGLGGGTDTALGRHPPGQTLPLGRQPPEQTPPLGRHPLPSACWDTPPCTVHVGIWSTSGWYTSYWNAYLLKKTFGGHQSFLFWVSKPGWIPHLDTSSPTSNGFLRSTSGVTPADLLVASIDGTVNRCFT